MLSIADWNEAVELLAAAWDLSGTDNGGEAAAITGAWALKTSGAANQA